ncbi:hypothetical protein D3C76_1300840 [compost metagenome]
MSTTVFNAVRSTCLRAISGVSGEPSLTTSRAISSRRVSSISTPANCWPRRCISSSAEQPCWRRVSMMPPVTASVANSELLGI